jgi:hypothetical protein
MEKLGFLVSCDCPDYMNRRMREPTALDLLTRFEKARWDVVPCLPSPYEETQGVLRYDVVSSKKDAVYTVLFSQADDDEKIEWACKHIISVIIVEAAKLGLDVRYLFPGGVQVFDLSSGEFVIQIDGSLQAVCVEVADD